MKIPLKPPLFSELVDEIFEKKNRFPEIMKHMTPQALPKKYLHWDKLRFYTPPDDLSRREWWYLIKTQRAITKKRVPLLIDKAKKPLWFNMTDTIQESLHQIDLLAGGQIEIPSQSQITNPETRDEYYIRSLIEEAITSSQLEGASTTTPVAKEMIRQGRKPTNRSETMILNNFNTMQSLAKFKNDILTPDLVFHIHNLITKNTLDDSSASGRFRLENESVHVIDKRDGKILHIPPEITELPDRLKRLCDFVNMDKNGFIHPVLKSIILHFQLSYDHPFYDGNGRTARALFYWSMLHHKYWLFEFISISEIILKAPAKYARAFLYTETDDNDLTYFITYHLRVICRAIESLHQYISKKTTEISQLESVLNSLSSLNHRQRGLIIHALKHPNYIYTVKGHKNSHNISLQTARADLMELVDLGFLNNWQRNRTWYFETVSNFKEKILELSQQKGSLLMLNERKKNNVPILQSS